MAWKIEPFLCPKFGNTVMLAYSKKRQLCPDCARKKNREECRLRHEKEMESIRIKNEALKQSQAPKVIKEKIPGLQQCRKCEYWAGDGGNQSERFCHFFLRNGVLRVHGDTPDDCRSFEPRKRRKKEEQLEHGKERLAASEAEYYAQRPRKKEEQENATR